MTDATTEAPTETTLHDYLGPVGVNIVRRQVAELQGRLNKTREELAWARSELTELHASLAAIEELAGNAPQGHVTGAYMSSLIGNLRAQTEGALNMLG